MPDTPLRIEIYNTGCHGCTGDIDVHMDDDHLARHVQSLHPRIPKQDEADQILAGYFEQYKEAYLGQLLSMMYFIVSNPQRMEVYGDMWKMAVKTVWPETWCKLHFDHIGSYGNISCDCVTMQQEWRTNPAFSMRKNEAWSVLDRIRNQSHGMSDEHFITSIGFTFEGDPPMTLFNVAMAPFSGGADYPEFQMPFVYVSTPEYRNRFIRLMALAGRVYHELKNRGQPVCERRHDRFEDALWLGPDEWEETLQRRFRLLQWLYLFLARDAGLDDEVMMFLAGGLLGVLNPWPNPYVADHPSEPQPEALDKQLAAWDTLVDCVYWAERRWAFSIYAGAHVAAHDRLVDSLQETDKFLGVVDRNRKIFTQDATARNRAFARLDNFIVPFDEPVSNNQPECPVCVEPWSDIPCHEPVKLRCCGQYIGRWCMKQWLSHKQLPRQLPEPKDPRDWVCLLCRSDAWWMFMPNGSDVHPAAPETLDPDMSFHAKAHRSERLIQEWNAELNAARFDPMGN
ncbi:hypothetical protein C8034_v008597 [Colletotrichum sidae]|uniref:RING-type domain-containing protein n=1 Tax=Colletotrichum sidae TaxID=1347389 RepID=A0A4R8T2F1_9PEZI|nr:hypothetical protein C8034_v008597 [Colletotrichum sidae]